MRFPLPRVAGLALGLLLLVPSVAPASEAAAADPSDGRKMLELKKQAVGGEAIWRFRT